mmetsp:Transcript_53489/g.152417  ORF Transcript_53489/g.152417 Transcript_53489/m.152417 type:complete len:361 (-) Transcript_53489:79-1161(-)
MATERWQLSISHGCEPFHPLVTYTRRPTVPFVHRIPPVMQSQRPSGDSFFSRPQLYGGFGGFDRNGKTFLVRSQRQRMNLVSLFLCLFIPWILFCLMYAVMSFQLHYLRPWLCYVLCGCGLLPVVISAGLAVRSMIAKLLPDQAREPQWFIFITLTMFVAWILGVIFGDLNFWTNMQLYYNYMNLNEYNLVNPATMRGQQLMDAGRIHFTNSSGLDLRRSMGFRNLDVYCVAPISIRGAGTMLPLASYDFWAVGLGCCSGNTADFHCGDYDNPRARTGLRLLRDDQRAFFRLAVQQAESTYSIKARHPLFFYWGEDPTQEMVYYRDEGYKYYLIGMLAHFGWQLLSTTLAASGFAKLGFS